MLKKLHRTEQIQLLCQVLTLMYLFYVCITGHLFLQKNFIFTLAIVGNTHQRHVSYQFMVSMLHSPLPITKYCFLFNASQAVTLVSFLYGHGKGQAFRLMMNHSEKYQDMAGLGTGDAITYSQTQACTKFISNMYGKESTSLTALRCEKAGDIKKHVTAKKLPPTDDAFCLHLQRVSYQLKVWRQACQAIQVLPSLFNYGYQRQAYSI